VFGLETDNSLQEITPVVQAGEGIVVVEVFFLLLGSFSLGDIE